MFFLILEVKANVFLSKAKIDFRVEIGRALSRAHEKNLNMQIYIYIKIYDCRISTSWKFCLCRSNTCDYSWKSVLGIDLQKDSMDSLLISFKSFLFQTLDLSQRRYCPTLVRCPLWTGSCILFYIVTEIFIFFLNPCIIKERGCNC